MKKLFKNYAIVWFILFSVFNAVAFAIPAWPTLEKYTPSFWIGYVFTIISLLGNLYCAWLALGEGNAKKVFYNIPLIKISFGSLVATFVVGGFFIAFSPLPYFIGAIICPIILIFNLVSILKAKLAAETISAIDEKVERKTSFIRTITVDANTLVDMTKDVEIKACCKKVYEGFRYSDPMSSEALVGVEENIHSSFEALKAAALKGEVEDVKTKTEELLVLIANRNNLCKINKK